MITFPPSPADGAIFVTPFDTLIYDGFRNTWFPKSYQYVQIPLQLTTIPEGAVRRFTGAFSNISFLNSGMNLGRVKFESGLHKIQWDGITWKYTNSGVLVYNSTGDVADPSLADWMGGTVVLRRYPIPASSLGQLAIVSTTNASGDFKDVWTCSNMSPIEWQPPGNILLDRGSFIYKRHFVDGGVPSVEDAYP